MAAYGRMRCWDKGAEKTGGLNNLTWPAKLLPSVAMRPPAVCKSVFLYRLGVVRSRLCPADLGLEWHHSGAGVFVFVSWLRPRQETK